MKDKTPETDEFETLRDAMNTSVHSDYFEALALCRKLEVERDEARKLAAENDDHADRWFMNCARYKRERDEARRVAKQYADAYGGAFDLPWEERL